MVLSREGVVQGGLCPGGGCKGGFGEFFSKVGFGKGAYVLLPAQTCVRSSTAWGSY